MANFEAFHWVISSSINLSFLKSVLGTHFKFGEIMRSNTMVFFAIQSVHNIGLYVGIGTYVNTLSDLKNE